MAVLEEGLGVRFRNPSLLDLALTHRSYAYEAGLLETNERLELLGDAVLNLVITDIIFKRFPTYVEGDLAKLRASLVSAPALAGVAVELGLGPAVRLGRGELMTGGRDKPSIMADALEAVIGAVYLDRGMAGIRSVVRKLFGDRIKAAIGQEVPKDAKTRLQEWVTRRHGILPTYRVSGVGPDHAKKFSAEVFVRSELYGCGEGRSKKEAEQAAATEAVARMAGEDTLQEVAKDA
ncbi:MAG TPA: ribonuclease III [Actinomycetota bacterium]|nr:ribonuclease III [Actinomycetota bacterium]